MKIGDLVCFNSAGQRKTSLGIVLGFERIKAADSWEEARFGKRFQIIQIQWVQKPKMLPGAYNNGVFFMVHERRHKLPTWYPNIGWFELAKPS